MAHIAGVDCLTSMSVPVFQRRFLHRCFRMGRTGMALMLGSVETSSRCLERIKSSGLFQCSQGENYSQSERMRSAFNRSTFTLKTFIMLQRFIFKINAVLLYFLFIKES